MSGDMKKRVLVTGGTGLVGSAIREVIESEKPSNEEWFYMSSKDTNLCDPKEVSDMFDKFKPTHVIHLAAKVGGLFANMKYKVEFWRENIMMNDNFSIFVVTVNQIQSQQKMLYLTESPD